MYYWVMTRNLTGHNNLWPLTTTILQTWIISLKTFQKCCIHKSRQDVRAPHPWQIAANQMDICSTFEEIALEHFLLFWILRKTNLYILRYFVCLKNNTTNIHVFFYLNWWQVLMSSMCEFIFHPSLSWSQILFLKGIPQILLCEFIGCYSHSPYIRQSRTLLLSPLHKEIFISTWQLGESHHISIAVNTHTHTYKLMQLV